ncbi:MAG: glycosyltransferase family 9 protein [Halobacteriovoraceae bacterium]|nr:glycosyltransferase family 9 protein [Halobacteriovoraceae bacterium]
MSIPKLNNKEDIPIDPIKKKICLVQITRLGDLIQTAFAARALKENDRNFEIYLIARSKFAKPLNFLLKEVFDKIFLMDTVSMIGPNNRSVKKSIKKINDFINVLNNHNIDILANLSFSKSASYLCSLINSELKLGPVYNQKLEIIIKDQWSQFLYSNVLRGPLCSFSLIDIYKKILGVKKKTTHHESFNLNKNNIIIHPFASLERKKWKANKWTEIIYKTLKDHSNKKIIIVGDKNDIDESFKIVDNVILNPFKKRIVNKTGKINIYQLSKLIKKSFLFVGHDSMVGHLAAYYNVDTLTISLGSVRPIETSPYINKGYNITPRIKCFPCFPQSKCDNYQCHNDISYQIISACINQLIKKNKITLKEIKEEASLFHIDNINIYRSKFTKQDMLDFDDITENNPNHNDIFRKYYRIAWLYFLNDDEEFQDIPILNDHTGQDLLNYIEGLKYLYELSEFGKSYSKYILEEASSKTPVLSKIRDHSRKIEEIDRLSEIIKESYPHLYPIIDYFLVVKGNLSGGNLLEIAQKSYEAYHNCSLLISVIYELIEKTVSKYKKDFSREKSK